MPYTKLIFTLLYLLSLILSLGVVIYTWKHRQTPGVSTYLWYLAGQSLWIGGFIVEMLTPGLGGKFFWDKVQWFAGLFIVIAFPVFTIQYTKTKLHYSRQLFIASFVVPVIFLILLVTDNQHHLIYPNPVLEQAYPFPELRYDFTWLVYAYSIYSYLTTFAGLGILTKHLIKPHSLYRGQILTIMIGFLIPITFSIMTVAGTQFRPFRDVSPLTFAVGNLVVAWGLFRYRTFEVTPVARDHIFEAMIDPVVILDNRNNIIDINRSMLDLLGVEADQAIGKPVAQVFEEFSLPIKMYSQVKYARTEASFDVQGKTVYYEMTVWPLFNTKREMVGRIYISHDITALKELESELRELNHELEERVAARTKDLAEAYDTTLEGWAKALELRDKETEDHSRRVTELTLILARAMGIKNEELMHIRRGAILHDIGKMGIPDEILRKRGELTVSERKVIEQHPEFSHKLLSQIPYLEKALDIPYCHHEKWDGSGYPRGLKGDEIPFAARIFSVVDVWDALRSDRPYSKAWSREKTIALIKEEAGTHFDPDVTKVFLKLVEQGKI